MSRVDSHEQDQHINDQPGYDVRAYLGDIGGRRVFSFNDENIVTGPDGFIGLKLYSDDDIEESRKRLIWLPTNQIVARQEELGESHFLDGRIVIHHGIRQAVVDGYKLECAPMEFSLLSFLAINNGTPQSLKDIFDSVWGDSDFRPASTVRVHVGRVRSKLGDLRWTVRTIKNWGYMFDDSFPIASDK